MSAIYSKRSNIISILRETHMSEKNRRKALKALAVGAPAIWAKPVVDSVVIPAHAVTSTCPPCTPFNGSWFTLTPVSESPCPELTWVVEFFETDDCSTSPIFDDIYFGPIDADASFGNCLPIPGCETLQQLSKFILPCGTFVNESKICTS